MLTTFILIASFLAIGFFARDYSRRTRLLILGSAVVGVLLLMRGQ